MTWQIATSRVLHLFLPGTLGQADDDGDGVSDMVWLDMVWLQRASWPLQLYRTCAYYSCSPD